MFSSKPTDEDHLYDFNTGYEGGGGGYKVPGTSGQRPPMTSARVPMSRGGIPGSRMGTSANAAAGEARPMTSVSGAGYQGSNKDSKNFDPLQMGKGPAPPLAEKSENSFEDKAREMEKKVHHIFESCAELIAAKDMQAALEKAKEAAKAERALCKFRETHGLVEQINIDLTYAICLTLAQAYHQNKMYEEALNTYQLIVKNKLYPQSGRLRVNMGNIYYEQKKYTQAIKMYRMALDQIPATGKELRHRISRNIGNSFVKLGQFQDAIDSYDSVIAGSPDIQTAFNLLLCLYARGDKEKMKKHFVKMLSIPIPGMTEEDEEKANDHQTDEEVALTDQVDALKEELTKRHDQANELIFTAARMIAPILEDGEDWILGYKWVMEQLRSDYEVVSSKLEVDLAMAYMKKRRFDDAIDVLKAFEKKDASMRAMAGANLSFIYFLEGDYQQAEKHADLAIRSDRYNAKGLVNKGNCLFMMGEYMRAKEYFLEAIGVEANCVEAIFNLGLTNLKINAASEAHQAFDKLFTILPNAPEALFQLGCIYETSSELEQAAETFKMLLNKMPGDPNVCARLGQVYEKLDDDNTACHWMTEAHRYFPVNLNVISWLGVWYVKREMYEEAIQYFERASDVQPGEVKWQLMVTSCYRRLGEYSKALELYQQIHEAHPQNIESLQYLEALCKDLGRPHDEYSAKLEKLKRTQPSTTMMTGAAPTRAAPSQSEAPQRSDRPRPDRPARPGNDDSADSPAGGRSPMAAPRAAGQQRPAQNAPPSRPVKKLNDDEDDFGDADVMTLLN